MAWASFSQTKAAVSTFFFAFFFPLGLFGLGFFYSISNQLLSIKALTKVLFYSVTVSSTSCK